jgi:hypothetical protein
LIIKHSWATSQINWLNNEKTSVSTTISVFAFRVMIEKANVSRTKISTLKTRRKTVLEMLVFSPLNQLT